MTTAKLFTNGRSQAVRLPKEFRFEGKEVRIRREGEAVILEPLKPGPEDEWAWLDEMPKDFDPTFEEAINELREADRNAVLRSDFGKAFE